MYIQHFLKSHKGLSKDSHGMWLHDSGKKSGHALTVGFIYLSV